MSDKYAINADLHLDARRANLIGDRIDPSTGLGTFSKIRLNAFEGYLCRLDTRKLITVGDLFNPNVDERLKKMVFELAQEHLDEWWIMVGNHETSRYYNTYSALQIFDLRGVELHIVEEPCYGQLLGHKISMLPWDYRNTKVHKDFADYAFIHADPKELKFRKKTQYVLGHIHDFKQKKRYTQLGTNIPYRYGEKASGSIVYLTEEGIEVEPCETLFDIVNVETQEDIDGFDPEIVCYRVNAKAEGLRFPKDAIRYVYFDASDECDEMEVEVTGATDTIKKDTKRWMKQAKVPKKLRKKILKRILKTVERCK